ncbi:MAG: MarR family winged helix-turn-helix transcriptional regulator [Actinomycetota bacterium]|nr:MarR family winged helix-turn-helix transcriptional regulator [Actinomycetota bacterium]
MTISDARAAAEQLSDELTRLFRFAHHARLHVTTAGDDAIERSAYALLARLVQDGPMRMTTLADAVHADPSTVSRQVSSLVRHKLVERKVDPNDGRGSVLVPTTEGSRVFTANREYRGNQLARMLAGWPDDEPRHLVRLLHKLNTEIETYDWESA